MKFAGLTLDTSAPDFVIHLLLFLLAVFAVKGLLALGLIALTARLFIGVETSLSEKYTNMVLSGDLKFLHQLSRHETLYALTGSVQAAVSGTLMPFGNIVTEISLLIYISVSFVIVNPALAIGALVFFLSLAALIQFVTGRSQKRSVSKMLRNQHDASDVLEGALNTYREITVANRSSYFSEAFKEKRYMQAKFAANMGVIGALPRYILDFSLIFGILLFLSVNSDFMKSPQSLQILGVFLAGSLRIVASLVPMQGSIIGMRSAIAESQVIKKFLSLSSTRNMMTTKLAAEINESHELLPCSVELRDVSFSYTNGMEKTLNSIQLNVHRGEFLAIVGKSGSGKSTLVDLMLGLQSPSAGEIKIDGLNPTDFIHANTSAISYVPQKPGLVHGTIAENIALGVPEALIEWGWLDEVITLSQLDDVIQALPDGVHSRLGKHTEGLSGGQIQRIGLARALYQRPRLMILDEATSALDAISENLISEALRLSHGRVTLVVIAHRLSTVKEADRVLILDQGQIVEEGSFRGLLKSSAILSEFAELMSLD